MGVTKTDLFSADQNRIATMAKALAHPARVAILQYLTEKNACINGDLVSELGLAQATISQHLRELKQIGIIKGTIEGNSINYCIDKENWGIVQNTFNMLFDHNSDCTEESCC